MRLQRLSHSNERGSVDHEPTARTKPTLATMVEEHLRDLVFRGALRPGQRLVNERIASELGISREPVREALRQLDGTGLVQIRERRGAVIAEFDWSSVDELVDLLRVRRALEPWVAAEAARRRRPEDLAAIDAALTAGGAALVAGDRGGAGRAHHEVLQAIARAAHNRPLIDAVTPLHNRTALAFSLVADRTIPDGWPAHHDVRDAIVAGDGAMAARVLRGHLDDVTRAVRRHPTVWRDDLLAAG